MSNFRRFQRSRLCETLAGDACKIVKDTFSLDVEDIPPLLRKDIIALGLDTVLSLLKYVEKNGWMDADLCQIMRSHIACNLTDSVRALHWK